MANRRKPARSTSQSASSKDINLQLNFGKTVYQFVLAAATGKTATGAQAREVACFGTRGDGKTQGAFGAMVAHAQMHKQAGYPLPTKWIGVTDTFAAHKNKTIESLNNPLWQGLWQIRDGGHLAVFGRPGCELVHLHLFGIEDTGAVDRVRTETVGVWFEEPAPAAVLVQSSGIDETAWQMAITSQRIASHHHPAIMTLNYPDEDHWTWQRFIANPHENTAYYRVPPGERASESQRSEWAKALSNRPDLLRRLLEGKPGVVRMGPEVATGFDEDVHVSRQPLEILPSEPIFIGWDFWHTPTAIIGQEYRGTCRVNAAMYMMGVGVRQLINSAVKPWLAKRAPWAMRSGTKLLHGYDPSGSTPDQSDTDNSAVEVINELLGGFGEPGPVRWEHRIGPGLSLLQRRNGLTIDPLDAKPLVQALSGRWYYPQDRLGNVSKDLPKKPNHPWEDLGDAWLYWVNRIAPNTQHNHEPLRVNAGFDPRVEVRSSVVQVRSDYDPRFS